MLIEQAFWTLDFSRQKKDSFDAEQRMFNFNFSMRKATKLKWFTAKLTMTHQVQLTLHISSQAHRRTFTGVSICSEIFVVETLFGPIVTLLCKKVNFQLSG